MRFEKKDILVLIPATLLAIAGLGPDDPWVVGPCLLLSWATFIVICVIHDGSRRTRTIVGALITVALSGVGYRRFNSIYHFSAETPKAAREITSANKPQPIDHIPSASEIADELAKRTPPIGKNGGTSSAKKPGPAFSVVIEDRIFSPGGNTPTRFRVFQANSDGSCNLLPVDLVLFIRITNLQDTDAMISAYNVELGGKEYQRIGMLMGALEWVPDKGTIPKVGTTIGWGQGTGVGHLSVQEVSKADPSLAASVTNAQILDRELGGKYLGPRQFARGWAFFEYAKGWTMLPLSDIKIKVTDQSGTTFSYKIPHKNPEGNANGDVLPRITTIGPITDLSRCSLER